MSDSNPSRLSSHHVVCFGELLMRLSAPGRERLLQSPRLDVHFGGAEANVAASLSILGHHSAIVSTLPDDAIGHACLGELRRHGVDTGRIGFAAGRMGLYFLSPGAMHRPSEVLYDRADSAFARVPADAYDWPQLLSDAHWLHVSGITLALSESAAGAALAAVRAAGSLGVGVSFDCNYRSRLWGDRAAQAPLLMREVVAHADLLFGNDRDVSLMLGVEFAQTDPAERFRAAADVAFAAWPRLQRMAATQRTHLSVDDQDIAGLLADSGTTHLSQTYRLTGIVDRIGGGDAFAAGLLHGLWNEPGDAAALDFAVAAACLKHSVPGDVNLLKDAEIRAHLSGYGYEVKR